jgi:hypothetical protein
LWQDCGNAGRLSGLNTIGQVEMTVTELNSVGFMQIGSWETPACRVHKATSIKGKGGLYAFVAGNAVRYIGKSDVLHRRLRNYSRRCFTLGSREPLRACHAGILATLASNEEVNVFAFVADDLSTLKAIEASLIKRFNPVWNCTGAE